MVDTILSLELKSEIGQEGRNSKVFIAYDPQLNAEVVVKKIDKSKEFTNEDEYFKEAQMLYASSHPNIMGVRYASQDSDNVYIVMDYYKKGSLNSLLGKRNLSVREIIKISLEFLSGLHYMHSKNLIHFDIKPTNILFNNTGKAVLTDFGLAKYLNQYGFANPDKWYNWHLPPEQFTIGKSSYYTDIYQVGLTLYRMCNGNNVLREEAKRLGITTRKELSVAIQKGQFPDRKSFLPHVPKRMQQIVKKALHTDVTDRYESVLDLINEISTVEENLDWVYTQVSDKQYEWVKEEENHKLKVTLCETPKGWETLGHKIRKDDNKTTRVTKWNTNGYNSKKDAMSSVSKLLVK
jgi:eukaryotic-like serine/threonine-protein kinase